MQKTNFTLIRGLQWMILPVLMLFTLNINAQTLSCNDNVQVSVDPLDDATCTAELTADMILEGTADPANYTIDIMGSLNQVLATSSNAALSLSVNGTPGVSLGVTYTVKLTDDDSGNSCWGSVVFEDKAAPVCLDSMFVLACTDVPYEVAIPVATDNCDFNPVETLVDEVVNTDDNCTGDTVTIVRTYIATDASGNVSLPCTVTIKIERPFDIDIPNDIVWTCEQYAAFPNIIEAEALHPFVCDSDDVTTPLVIEVDLNPDFDDNDFVDIPTISSTSVSCDTFSIPVTGLEDADVLELTGSGVPGGYFSDSLSNPAPVNGDIVEDYCKYNYSHSDVVLSTCGFEASTDEPVFKIVRTWTVLDWCTGLVVTSFSGDTEDNVQIIKVIDEVEPTISLIDVVVSANIPGAHPQPCSSQGPIAIPTPTDNCTGATITGGFIYADVALAVPVASVNLSNGIFSPALDLGTYFLVFTAEDGCGNVGQSATVTLTVIDDIVPTAICDEITTVSLSSDGLAVVAANVFDDGSYDNCCVDRFEVRKMNDDDCDIPGVDNNEFGPTVTFCCEEIATSPIMVVFRAFDCSDNFNDCMVEVLVEDKQPPSVICPINASISCDTYWDVLEAPFANCDDDDDCESDVLTDNGFGSATWFDNCEVIEDVTVNINIDNCGDGSITRIFTADDPSGNGPVSCIQTISVFHVSDWAVMFPDDKFEECGNDAPDFGEPEIYFKTCELIAVSYEDALFTVVPDACYKIVREWTVINWCTAGDDISQEYVELSEAEYPFPTDFNGNGRQTFINQPGTPGATIIGHSWRTFRENRGTATGPIGAENPDGLDIFGNPIQDGYIRYQQVIKVNDTVQPEYPEGCEIPMVCIVDNTCGATVILPEPPVDDCSEAITTASGDLGSGYGPFFNVPPGTYEVIYQTMDQCGNSNACFSEVTVMDCKKPTPYCKDGLVVELMAITDPNNTTFIPMVEIWANDFDEGSFDNCPGDLKLSFSSDVNDISAVYTCDNVGENTVQMWVTDAKGNQDYCETFVIIQANMGQCVDPGDPLVAAGAISNEDNAPVEDVTVELSGQSNAMVNTDVDGNFTFNVPVGNDITITPSKDNDPLNGVTTLDLVFISKHILGTQLLDSPYKMIAADANNSQGITTLDLVQLRKLILHIDTEFANNTSWRFVDKDFTFANVSNPWSTSFPEVININNIAADVLAADFVAIKVGDVNMSAATSNNLLGADDRSNGTFTLNTNDRMVKAGETVTVEFTAEQAAQGYQFTMNFNDALDFVTLEEGVATEENFGFTMLNEGVITASWNGEGIANDVAFAMTFTANADVMLSEALNINSRYTAAEAYNNNNEVLDVELTFNNATASTFELYQNTPNPFNGETVIGFNLPEAGAATLTVTDMSGKVITVVEGAYSAGYNQVRVSNLPATGVMYYTLNTANETATKKMVATK